MIGTFLTCMILLFLGLRGSSEEDPLQEYQRSFDQMLDEIHDSIDPEVLLYEEEILSNFGRKWREISTINFVALQNENLRLKNNLKKLTKEIEQLRSSDTNQALNERLLKLKKENIELKNKLKEHTTQIEQLRTSDTNQALNETLVDLKKENKELKNNLKKLTKEIEQLRSDDTNQALNGTLVGLKKEFIDVRKKLATIQKGLSASERVANHSVNSISSLDNRINKLNSTMSNDQCISPWIRTHHGLCVVFSHDETNFTSAMGHCAQYNSSLVTFRNKDEYEDLAKHLVLKVSCPWMGVYWLSGRLKFLGTQTNKYMKLKKNFKRPLTPLCGVMCNYETTFQNCNLKTSYVCRKNV